MRRIYIPAPRRAPVWPALVAGAFLATAFAGGMLLPIYSTAPSYQLVALTRSGDVYIAGAGSSCKAASRNAVIPHDWTRITCERSRFSAR